MDGFDTAKQIIESLQELHLRIASAVHSTVAAQKFEENAEVVAEGNGDVTYRVDAHSEALIDNWFSANGIPGGAVVICEGLGIRTYPAGLPREDAAWRVIIDPLDGTRHIMYDNRSCWILTGIARNRGDKTSLADIVACIQTEVPPSRQDRSLVLKAVRGQGASAEEWNIAQMAKTKDAVRLRPSRAKDLLNGFAVFSSFFPGTKEIISAVEERVLERIHPMQKENDALVFSEQYICSAGQMYMLMSGRYRMVADIRAALGPYQQARGKLMPLCTHPYDLCASLIAEELGCVIVDLQGRPLHYPLDLDTNCSWLGFANSDIRDLVWPVLAEELERCLE